MNPDANPTIPSPDTSREAERPLEIEIIGPDDRDGVKAWYEFDIQKGFNPPEHQDEQGLEERVDYWQQQLRDGNIGIALGMNGDRVVATTSTVLRNGTLGRTLKENEAWAVGTVVDPDLRSHGIGEQMAKEQHRIARNAGKEYMRAAINPDNASSMRLRMNKVGYVLEGVGGQPDTRIKDNDPKNRMYYYRKDLRPENEQSGEQGIDWVAEVASGKVVVASEPIDEKTPERILVDPGNRSLVKEAVDQGYRGVFLIRPEDTLDEQLLEQNYIIFVREAAGTNEQ
ncbi:MAG: GNAT family N-acetyltransferase [Candidatus Kerfeldbacteria bacterium]